MDHYVITISRKFGSLGHEIASGLGKELGIPVYDRSAVEAQVQSLGLDVRREAERQLKTSRQDAGKNRQGSFLFWKKEQTDEEEDRARIMYEAQAEVLHSFAEKSSCIILGRCGDQVFRDYKRCMNVYIFAPDEVRVQNCIRMLNTDEKAVRALIRKEDSAREAYRKRFCEDSEDQTRGRHLLIDSSVFGARESVKLIASAARYLFLCDEERSDDI